MEVAYHLDADDFRALYRYLVQDQRRADPRKQLFWFRLESALAAAMILCDLGLVWLLGFFLATEGIEFLDWSVWLVFGIFFLLLNGVLFLLVRDLRLGVRGHSRMWLYGLEDYLDQQRRSGELDPERTVRAVLAPEGLTEIAEKQHGQGGVMITAKVTSVAPWTVIATIHVTADHAFFQVGTAGWLILPKRAFPSEDHFFKFVAQAKRYQEGSPTHSAEPELRGLPKSEAEGIRPSRYS